MSDPDAFWHFSLAYYARLGTAEVCLPLQDDIRLDVNVMLFLLWQAQCGRRVGAADIRSLIEFVAEWSRLGVFNKISAELARKAGTPSRLMIDATHLKAHRTAASLLKKCLFPAVRGARRAA